MNPVTMAIILEWTERVPLHQPAWMFIFLFVLIGIFAWIRLYYGSILIQTFQASTNFLVASRIFKDNSLLQKQLDNILYLFYFLSAAYLLYVAETRLMLMPYMFSGLKLYLFNLGLLSAYFMSKLLLINLAGFLFNRLRLFREYLYNSFIFNKILGITMLPLLVCVVYTTGLLKEVFQWMAVVAVFTILILRLIRGIVFSFKKDVSIFYMFLYLCALEITPLALLYNWLEGIL